ncbi:hypothetical protein [Caulobacter sp. S45]|jgi:hypothetical protein|uniref:hypothetical protein n=1 Tax=Caulobacter sp. S45 TaxID=1641861 RepID=UPI00131DB696|nr:hypothetical protein [Caulobacter sp. S45]
MSDQNDQPEKKTATQTLAELVARRKAGAGNAGSQGFGAGKRQDERAAAARSAAKSKPAMRK